MSELSFNEHLAIEIERTKKAIETKQRRRARQRGPPSSPEHYKPSRQEDPAYEVVIDGPLRRVLPYYFTFRTFCKARWRNKRLIDIFSTEFRNQDPDYYRRMIVEGKVFVNHKVATLDTVLQEGDLITHEVHRHEPPVTSQKIEIVYEDDDIVVIDKPCSIPVHPTGRYRFNTVTKILERDFGYVKLRPCNRLDKQTSGLMFLAKTSRGADRIGDQLKVREVHKEYIARVVGEFPVEEIVVEKPIRSIEPRVSLSAVCSMDDSGAKHAKTVFRRISYDGQTSVVKCTPLTGRSHQIRVHLQWLGHPIANDPIYSNIEVWGPNLGRGKHTDFTEIIRKLDEIGRSKVACSWYFQRSPGETFNGEHCPTCGTKLYTDPGPNNLQLWLHCYRYESLGSSSEHWSYKTSFPEWALQPHRKYMKQAISEAEKCGPTKTAFNVGAVLVNGTRVLSTGYSRELPGNTHAEQCALEKYFVEAGGQRDVPPGSVLYTTMEPCSLRLSGNEPCVQRILSLRGHIRTVFVGIMEPDTFVKNNTSLALLESNGIDYILIPGYETKCTEVACRGHDE